MWKYFVENMNEGKEVDKTLSFYCGDAAGRRAGWKKGLKKDHSSVDRAFAHNNGLKFTTPEETFLNEKPTEDFEFGCIDGTKIVLDAEKTPKPLIDIKPHSSLELILMVAPPASGKSTFSKKHFVENGYTHINRDTLKTQANCLKKAEESLSNKVSVVIDNTNPTIEARKAYIDIAKRNKARVRCVIINIDRELSRHLNIYREAVAGVDRIPTVAYNVYYKNYVKPTKKEGIDEIVEVEFHPYFKDELHRDLFMKRYSE